MGFEIVRPIRHGLQLDPLTSGTVSVSRQGDMTVCVEDLALANVEDAVVLLADRDSGFRLGMRRPRDGEDDIAVRVRPVIRTRGRPAPGRRRINLRAAICELGLEVGPETAGRYTLFSKGKDDEGLLIIDLSEARGRESKRGE